MIDPDDFFTDDESQGCWLWIIAALFVVTGIISAAVWFFTS